MEYSTCGVSENEVRITPSERLESWAALIDVLPAILGQCDDFALHPDQDGESSRSFHGIS